MTPARLVACVCAAQVCAQIGAYTWPALLPGFLAEWRISNWEVGWITGIFYAAYTVAVPGGTSHPPRAAPPLTAPAPAVPDPLATLRTT